MKRIIIILSCIAFFSCNGNKMPAGVLPQPKMEEVLWDYVCADIYATDFAKDSLTSRADIQAGLRKSVFQKHKITQETFSKSYKYYEEHGNLMQALLDSVVAKQSRIKEKERTRNLKTLTSQ